MKFIKFEWDAAKATANKNKHGISFDEAETVFYDEHALLIADPEHSINEERYLLLGLSWKPNLILVCHCYRTKEEVVRIISARKATKNECKEYMKRLT
jgi:uncharacterized protein